MELKLVTFLAILAPANAQFHLTNALNVSLFLFHKWNTYEYLFR